MHFFIAFLAGIVIFKVFPYFPFSSIFSIVLISLIILLKRKFISVFIILTGIITGISYAYIRYEPDIIPHYFGREATVNGIFVSYPIKNNNDTYNQIFRITSAVDSNSQQYLQELDNQEITLFSDKAFEPGLKCKLRIKFLKNRERLNPGEQLNQYRYANVLDIYNEGEKIISLNKKIQDCRHRINVYIEKHFTKDSAALISSITTGHRALMNEDLKNAFNRTGLAHILSISGTHFGLFSLLLFGMSRLIIKILPYSILQRITIFFTPAQAAALLSFPFMLTYLGISGSSIPAVRSFIMISLFLFGMLIDRKGFWLNSLLLAALIIALWNPEHIFSLSFQLSFIAVFFIGMFIKDKKTEEGHRIMKYIKNILLIPISASIGIAPLVAYYFHYFSFISPISNLLVAPLIGFIIIPLSVLSSLIYLVSGYFIFTPLIEFLTKFSISLVRLLSEIPFAAIKIPNFPPILLLLFYLGFIFYFLLPENISSPSSSPPPLKGGGWGRGDLYSSLYKLIFRNVSSRQRYTILIPFIPVLIYFSFAIFEKKYIEITFLDVGQGDSAVIELPDGKTIVTDTGKTGRETATFLDYRGKRTVDALILSHSHPDHTGGLYYLLDRFEIREIWYNGRMIFSEMPDKLTFRAFKRGDRIDGDNYSIYILHPYPEFYTSSSEEYSEANNDSLVLKIQSINHSFLFTGDIEEEAEESILHIGDWLKSNVLKVPHHGGKTSAYQPFFRSVSPQIAVISCGRGNTFGHPHQDTIDALDGAEIFRTDVHGAIKITESANGLKIKTYKDFRFKQANSILEEMSNIKKLFQTW